jgi:hypothetical protein
MTDLLANYTKAMWVVDTIRDGHTLTQACKRCWVSRATIIGMMSKDATLRQMILDATSESEDMMADMLVNIDQMYPDPKMAKVISDNIKWLLARRRGGEYGDRMVVESTSTTQDQAILGALHEAIKRIPMPEQPEDFKVIEAEPLPIAAPD